MNSTTVRHVIAAKILKLYCSRVFEETLIATLKVLVVTIISSSSAYTF